MTCPGEFITIADGHWLWKDFSLFSVVSGCHYLSHAYYDVNVDYCICVANYCITPLASVIVHDVNTLTILSGAVWHHTHTYRHSAELIIYFYIYILQFIMYY